MRRRDFMTLAAGAAGMGMLPTKWAMAQTRAESLRILSEAGPNSFDTIGVGVNRNAIQATWNVYDRLVRFGTKTQPDGTLYYDYYAIEGELAERWVISDDKRSITFHLRRDATFHDGTPVTSADVKWSLDRVVSIAIGKSQFSTGSMTEPSQFEIIDTHTIKITTPKPDPLHPAQHGGGLSDHHQFQGRQGQCDRCRPLGQRVAEDQCRRRRVRSRSKPSHPARA